MVYSKIHTYYYMYKYLCVLKAVNLRNDWFDYWMHKSCIFLRQNYRIVPNKLHLEKYDENFYSDF